MKDLSALFYLEWVSRDKIIKSRSRNICSLLRFTHSYIGTGSISVHFLPFTWFRLHLRFLQILVPLNQHNKCFSFSGGIDVCTFFLFYQYYLLSNICVGKWNSIYICGGVFSDSSFTETKIRMFSFASSICQNCISFTKSIEFTCKQELTYMQTESSFNVHKNAFVVHFQGQHRN